VQVGITHIGILTGAFGEGLLTHHDFLEAIAGDIPIGDKKAEPRAVQREDGSWLLDGMLPIDEFKGIIPLEEIAGKKNRRVSNSRRLFVHSARARSVRRRPVRMGELALRNRGYGRQADR
jgi:CBS domain containing-hemolysin-like protein